MASSRSRRRFIAGATCPACGAVDKVFVEDRESGLVRGCSRCESEQYLDDVGADSSVQPIKLLE